MIISNKLAREFIIYQQLLGRKDKTTTTLDIIKQLGYIQIDTISVMNRTHHHVAWTRNGKYKKGDLQNLIAEKKIFDYWAHAASYLPMNDYRYSLVKKNELRKGDGFWYSKNKKKMRFVLDKIRAEGPLMSKDFAKEKVDKSIPWQKSESSQALMHLFMDGELMISGREGFHKKFELTERYLPSNVSTEIPSDKEYLGYLIRRDLKAHGLMKKSEIGHLLKIDRKKLAGLLNQMVEEKELIQFTITNQSDHIFYVNNNCWTEFQLSKPLKKLHILSPFDNLIIQRKRLKELFDFEYILECYVPAAKRKVGYYSMPILYGQKFIGQIDMKADQKTNQLNIRNLVWEDKYKNSAKSESQFRKKLNQVMTFNNCQEIIGLENFFS